jgi:hypothetical protein
MRRFAGIRAAALGLGLATIAVAGCGMLRFAGPPPDWVTDRAPLPLCGEESPRQVDEEARRCLLDAFLSGGEGELISTMTSIEGDPITRYVRVHADGTVKIFHDATQDRFGSGRWEHLTCRALLPVEETNDAGNFSPPEYVFSEVDCQ